MTFEEISRRRAPIMGIAMLMIVVFHSTVRFSGNIDILKNMGDFGVNIFYLMSGLSMYYSWVKRPSITGFLKRRLTRIFICFYPILILCSLLLFFTKQISLKAFLLKILMLSFWVNGNLMYWFINGLIVLYIITPFWIKIFNAKKNKCMIATIIILICLIVLARTSLLIHIRCFIDRIPVYFCGIIIGCYAKQKIVIKKVHIFFQIILVFIGLILFYLSAWNISNYNYKYLIYLFITIPFVMLAAIFLRGIEKNKLYLLLEVCGIITLEMYLFQERITTIVSQIINKLKFHMDVHLILLNVVSIIIAILGAIVWHKFCDKMLMRLRNI